MGTGIYGGFGDTKGFRDNRERQIKPKELKYKNVPVKKLGDVRYSQKKTEGYLLNPEHPVGASKAKFMRDVLGYTQGDGKLFHKNVVLSIIGMVPKKTEITQFGVKHTYQVTLRSKANKEVSANVVIVIQKDNKRITYKLVTVYPDKKEK